MKNKKIYIVIAVIIFIILAICTILMRKKEEQKQQQEKYLTNEQLQEFDEFFEEKENNGFLLSEYANADEINLEEVIYNGIGEEEEITEEERKEYYDAIKKEDYELNVTSCSKEEIENLYKEKTGKELINIDDRLKNWKYLPEYDKYYKEHTDTNYTTVRSDLGKVKDNNIYTVYVTLLNNNEKHVKVTLQKNGDSYQFISNEYI